MFTPVQSASRHRRAAHCRAAARTAAAALHTTPVQAGCLLADCPTGTFAALRPGAVMHEAWLRSFCNKFGGRHSYCETSKSAQPPVGRIYMEQVCEYLINFPNSVFLRYELFVEIEIEDTLYFSFL